MKNNNDSSIHFFSESTKFILKQKQITRGWLMNCVASEKKKIGALNFIFCSDIFLRRMNKKFLNHNYFTDIITFPVDESSNKLISGDIYISIDRVRENAKTYGVRVNEELYRVMAHGVLHLCGYGDKTENEIRLMRKKESFYLANRCL